MTYEEKKSLYENIMNDVAKSVKKILNESESDTNEEYEIVKFDKKHAYCDCSFYYGYYIKTSMKVLKSILGRPQHTGSDECEWNSSSVEWWKMLKTPDTIIPFKLYDYNNANALDDKDTIVYWRIGSEKDKKEEQSIVQKHLLSLINDIEH